MIPRHIHFIGIGGAGMAPLAFLLLRRGCAVSGSDECANANTDRLAAAGAKIAIGHDRRNLTPGTQLIVYSSAVPADNPERQEGARRNLPELRRGELLAELSRFYRRVVAVSGSHGKSSITAMLAHILTKAGADPGYVVGAKLYGAPDFAVGSGDDLFITEADESDATHTLLRPSLGIVPNFDTDHAWSVGGEAQLAENFRTFARNSRQLLCGDTPECRRLFADFPAVEFLADPIADFAGFSGFQAINAQLAAAAAVRLGIPEEAAIAALASFGGVMRRMHVVSATGQLVVIEDYAHHPKEVESALALIRRQYPHRHLRVVFQPHRYARLEKYFAEFAAVLSHADSVIVTPVFAAWSETGKRGGAELAAAIAGARYCAGSWADVAACATGQLPKPAVVAILGAGTINEVLNYLDA